MNGCASSSQHTIFGSFSHIFKSRQAGNTFFLFGRAGNAYERSIHYQEIKKIIILDTSKSKVGIQIIIYILCSNSSKPLCRVLRSSLPSNLSTLTNALMYSERAAGFECNEGWLSKSLITPCESLRYSSFSNAVSLAPSTSRRRRLKLDWYLSWMHVSLLPARIYVWKKQQQEFNKVKY